MIEKEIDARSRPALDQKLADYIRKYHPAGYGTHVVKKWEDGDGHWYAIVRRAASCD